MRIVNLSPAPTIQQGSASKKEINKQVSKEIKMDFGSGFRSGLANSETGRESKRAFTHLPLPCTPQGWNVDRALRSSPTCQRGHSRLLC